MSVEEEATNLKFSQDAGSLDNDTTTSLSELSNKRKAAPSVLPEVFKRPRHGSLTYNKHPQFWALDGNILLQIERTRFKLHQSRLAAQSPWFNKLFLLKSGGILVNLDENEAGILGVLALAQDIDGCNLYNLSPTGVTLKNFVRLLSAMDDAIGFYHKSPEFLVVASIHRAANVLNFPQFLNFTKKYITAKFPGDVKSVKDQKLEFAVEAVLLGRSCGLPSILKRAFYELARKDPDGDESDDSESSESSSDSTDSSDDSTNQESGDSDSDSVESGGADSDDKGNVQSDNGKEKGLVTVEDKGQIAERTGATSTNNALGQDDDEAETRNSLLLLDPADLVRLLSAQKQLTTSWLQVFSWKPKCSKRKGNCTKTVLQEVIHGSGLITTYERDPICGLRKLYNIDWNEKGYCNSCAANIVTYLKERQKHIWDKLDDWFGL